MIDYRGTSTVTGHCTLQSTLTEHLNEQFTDRWIGRGVPRTGHYGHRTSLSYIFVKSLVCKCKINRKENLHNGISGDSRRMNFKYWSAEYELYV
jgi:uncharacterized membrane protein YukC